MKKLRTITDKNRSIIVSVGIGIAAAMIISLILTLVMTSFIEKGKLEGNGNFWVFIARTVSAFVGALLGSGLSKNKILPVIGAVIGGYFILLLAIGLLFLDGGVSGMLQGLLSVVIGGALAYVIKLKPQKTRRKSLRLVK